MSIIAIIFFAFLATGCQPPGDSYAQRRRTGVAPARSSWVVPGAERPCKLSGDADLRGAMSYLNHVNEQECSRPHHQVVAYDDSYDPPCAWPTPEAHHRRPGFLPFCYVGPHDGEVLPLIEEARIPLLGMFTGANALREPFSRFLVNVRASYYQETGAAVRHLVDDWD